MAVYGQPIAERLSTKASVPFLQPISMTNKKIAVVGAGHLGRIHAKLVSSIENVDAVVVEPAEASRRNIESEFGLTTFADLSELDFELDGAIVVTPTDTHFDVATQLLESNCHLLVEKPICGTSEESKQLCELAEGKKRVLQVGHVERFNPAFVAAKNSLNHPKYIETVRNTPFTFRATDVSVIKDLMIHDIDLVLSIVNSPVASVSATGTAVVGPNYDMAKAWVEFENGCVACLTASRCSYVGDRSMQAVTQNGHVSVDFAKQLVKTVTPVPSASARLNAISTYEEKMRAKDQMFEKWLPVTEEKVTPQNAILAEQTEFLNCIETGSRPTVSGWDGFAAVQLADQIETAIAARSASATQTRKAA